MKIHWISVNIAPLKKFNGAISTDIQWSFTGSKRFSLIQIWSEILKKTMRPCMSFVYLRYYVHGSSSYDYLLDNELILTCSDVPQVGVFQDPFSELQERLFANSVFFPQLFFGHFLGKLAQSVLIGVSEREIRVTPRGRHYFESPALWIDSHHATLQGILILRLRRRAT